MKYVSAPQGFPWPGMVAVQVTLCLTVVMGVAAVVLDGGLLLAERQRGQAVADAAAQAAVIDVLSDSSPYTRTKQTATNVASANGYTSPAPTVKIPGDVPLQSSSTITDGAGKLKAGYVEVTVQYNQPRYFSGIFGSGTIPVKARAVAQGRYGLRYVNILVLDSTAGNSNKGGALNVAGNNSTMTVPGAIVVDSSSNYALTTQGSGATIVSQSGIDVVGAIGTGSTVYAPAVGSTANVQTGTSSVSDPLINLPVPDASNMAGWIPPGTANITNYSITSGTDTIYPGIYHGGINIQGASVTMMPGIYYLEGGQTNKNYSLYLSGSGTQLRGDGVMIYNGQTNGTSNNSNSVGEINISGGSVVHITPMTTGTYAGISIFQDRNATAPLSISGGSGTYIGGAIYAASAPASVSGSSDIIPGVAFITDTLSISGSSNFTLPQSTIQIPDPSKPDVRLVE